MTNEFDDLLPKNIKKGGKHKDLLDQLKEIEDVSFETTATETTSFLPSSMLKEPKKKKKESTDDYNPDDWFNEMLAGQSPKIKKGGKPKDLFDSAGIGKKKKKKKKGDKTEQTDFKKEFEPEMLLYKNLLVDQNRFTDTLQREYDLIKSTKSSSRGVTKQITDLIENITDARSLSMQLIEKNVNAKKLIAELTLKQKKELGLTDGDGENMADFASSYLKQMLNDRKSIVGASSAEVSEYTEDELFNELSSSLYSEGEQYERPEEVDKYLKYENSGVEVYCVIHDNDASNFDFIAKDSNDNELDDYPLPMKTSISVNRSTGIATDSYGKKYTIIWD